MVNKEILPLSILFGGLSTEREVSIESAREIFPILSQNYDVDLVELNESNQLSFIDEIKNGSLVFNALHGGDGENGQVQALLDQKNIMYTGSSSTASMLAMNKHFTKIIAVENNIKTPDWLTFKINGMLFKPRNKIKFPVVVKPNFQGSTLGLSIINTKDELNDALNLASLFSSEIIVEKYIKGRELTVGILGNKALDVVEIIPKTGIYDYESKYTKGKTDYVAPATINQDVEFLIKSNALKLYKALGCRHYARVDFILEDGGALHLLELNSLPGLCSTSLLPMSAKSTGINFKELLDIIINIALLNR